MNSETFSECEEKKIQRRKQFPQGFETKILEGHWYFWTFITFPFAKARQQLIKKEKFNLSFTNYKCDFNLKHESSVGGTFIKGSL